MFGILVGVFSVFIRLYLHLLLIEQFLINYKGNEKKKQEVGIFDIQTRECISGPKYGTETT